MTRSEIMSRIRSRNTGIERVAYAVLRHAGALRWPTLPGSPDFLIPHTNTAIFVDGCFWHGCRKHFRLPKTNSEFWAAKIRRNRERDAKVTAELEDFGFRVERVWEHELRRP